MLHVHVYSELSGLVSGLDGGHCKVFLSKILNFHSASVHPGVLMGTGEF